MDEEEVKDGETRLEEQEEKEEEKEQGSPAACAWSGSPCWS